MSTSERTSGLTALARVGFTELGPADRALSELAEHTGQAYDDLVLASRVAADPDRAVSGLVRVARRNADAVRDVLARTSEVSWRLFGASEGFAEFYFRHPEELTHLPAVPAAPGTADEFRAELLASVDAEDGFAAQETSQPGWRCECATGACWRRSRRST